MHTNKYKIYNVYKHKLDVNMWKTTKKKAPKMGDPLVTYRERIVGN